MPTSIPYKILHVINSLAMGGAEKLVADLAPRQRERGAVVRVLALNPAGDAFSYALRVSGVETSFACAHEASPYMPLRVGALRRAIAEFKPDILHAHLSPSFQWCAIAASTLPKGKRPRLIATEHAVLNRRMASRLLTAFDRPIYRRYGAIACVSAEAAAALERWLGPNAARDVVIPNGIELRSFSPGGSAPDPGLIAWKAGRFLIAMTARLVPPKDHATALRALALLPEDYALAFIGEGPERHALEALATSFGVVGRVKFLGSRADIAGLLAASDAYMQSSKDEGFGIAALEAMASGLPVAASAVGGLKALASGAALLVDSGDEAGFAAALKRIREDPRERTALIRAGIEHTVEGYALAYRGLMESA
jgi:glycosyltransferase involved in cell wall biosynthesis